MYNAYEHPDITSALRGGYPVPPQAVKATFKPELVEVEEMGEDEFIEIVLSRKARGNA